MTRRRLCDKLQASSLDSRSIALERLTATAIQAGLCTNLLGKNIISLDVVDSTNALAMSLARQGAPEGTLVIAEDQTAGRGRLGRPWWAPARTSLLLSLIFRPEFEARRAQGLTMTCGLAVRAAVRTATGLVAQLKWPNDIVLRGRKAGGILTNMSVTGERLASVVVGIGLNVNIPLAALPPEFQATSLSHELGQPVPRIPLLQNLLLEVERRYENLRSGKWPVEEWAAALETLGQHVALHTSDGQWEGTAESVDEEGALLVRLDSGQLRRVLVGDVVAAPRAGGARPQRCLA